MSRRYLEDPDEENLSPLSAALKGEGQPRRVVLHRFWELLDELLDADRGESLDCQRRAQYARELLPGALDQLIDERVRLALRRSDAE